MVLNDNLKMGINSMFSAEIDFSDRRVPLGICGTCRTGVYSYNSTKINTKKLELLHRTFEFIIIPPETRSEQVCFCMICKVAKAPVKVGNFKKVPGAAKKLVTIPENAPPKPTGTIPKKEPPRCNDCLSKLGPGYPHDCCQETLDKNLQEISEKNPAIAQKQAAGTLRSKEPSPGGRVHLALSGRSSLAVAVNAPPASKRVPPSAEDIRKFGLEMGFGIGKQEELGRQMNKWYGPNSVQTGFQKGLRDMSKIVAGKCHVTHLEFEVKGASNLVSLPIWAVDDLEEYVTWLHEQ